MGFEMPIADIPKKDVDAEQISTNEAPSVDAAALHGGPQTLAEARKTYQLSKDMSDDEIVAVAKGLDAAWTAEQNAKDEAKEQERQSVAFEENTEEQIRMTEQGEMPGAAQESILRIMKGSGIPEESIEQARQEKDARGLIESVHEWFGNTKAGKAVTAMAFSFALFGGAVKSAEAKGWFSDTLKQAAQDGYNRTMQEMERQRQTREMEKMQQRNEEQQAQWRMEAMKQQYSQESQQVMNQYENSDSQVERQYENELRQATYSNGQSESVQKKMASIAEVSYHKAKLNAANGAFRSMISLEEKFVQMSTSGVSYQSQTNKKFLSFIQRVAAKEMRELEKLGVEGMTMIPLPDAAQEKVTPSKQQENTSQKESSQPTAQKTGSGGFSPDYSILGK